MKLSGSRIPSLLLPAMGLLLSALVVSCKTKGGGDFAAQIAAGQIVFEKNGCKNCHAVGGEGGRKGPDLTHVGKEAGHTPEWLTDHTKNPKTHNPGSRMPAFEGKIDEKGLVSIGAYLSSLK